MSKIILIAIVVGLIACTPITAGDVYRYNGLLASASYYAVDVNNISTSAYLIARDTVSQSPPGGRELGSSLLIWVIVYDNTGQQTLLDVYEEKLLLPNEFRIDQSMRTATLNTSFDAYDCVSAQDVPLMIDLRFTAIGKPVRGIHQDRSQTPDGFVNIRAVGIQRDAEVIGSIGGSANLTTEPFDWANFYASTEFEVTVQ